MNLKQLVLFPSIKKGEKSKEGNYRPVSILPIISKIFEKVVYNQVNDFLSAHNILYDNQSGFRQSFSTDTALISLCDKIRCDMDKGNVTGIILLDLQKAFDTVNHTILLDKLSAIGMDNKSVSWFKSYLTNRGQFVDLAGTLSPKQEINCGVPQGSILGPLLFLIYVNDMCRVIDNTCNLYLYADDSALAVNGKNILEIESCLNKNINNISSWLQENRLSLHLGKTECILFGTRGKLKQQPDLNIVCNGIKINNTTSVKYLGAILDCYLSGIPMYENTLKKINNSIKFLYRKRSFLCADTRKLLVNALVQPRFDYASNFWFRAIGKVRQKKLQICQNKCIRFIHNLDNRSHLEPNHWKSINILNVNNRIDYLSVCQMYKMVNGKCPEYLKCLIPKYSHRYNTRSGDHAIFVPKVGSNGHVSFAYNAIKLWNSLPPKICKATGIETFKIKCKSYMFSEVERNHQSHFV